jgi:hypothetical protein
VGWIFKRLARILLPVAGFLAHSFFPSKEEKAITKVPVILAAGRLIAGDMHYIQNTPDMRGKFVITNTTTEKTSSIKNLGYPVLTTTPRYDGRSFGVNMMEGVLTAYAGLGRQLTIQELNALIDELDLRPSLQVL